MDETWLENFNSLSKEEQKECFEQLSKEIESVTGLDSYWVFIVLGFCIVLNQNTPNKQKGSETNE